MMKQVEELIAERFKANEGKPTWWAEKGEQVTPVTNPEKKTGMDLPPPLADGTPYPTRQTPVYTPPPVVSTPVAPNTSPKTTAVIPTATTPLFRFSEPNNKNFPSETNPALSKMQELVNQDVYMNMSSTCSLLIYARQKRLKP